MSNQFDKLKIQLEQLDWPKVYYFKFICPSDPETVAKVSSLFESNANLTIRASKNGNYASISAKEVMINPEAVIHVYEESAKIKGVISL